MVGSVSISVKPFGEPVIKVGKNKSKVNYLTAFIVRMHMFNVLFPVMNRNSLNKHSQILNYNFRSMLYLCQNLNVHKPIIAFVYFNFNL